MRMFSRKAGAIITSSVVVLALDTLALIPRAHLSHVVARRSGAKQ